MPRDPPDRSPASVAGQHLSSAKLEGEKSGSEKHPGTRSGLTDSILQFDYLLLEVTRSWE